MAQPSALSDISDLVLRVVSAIVALPLAVAMVWQGGWMFVGFLALLAAAMGWELAAMARAATWLRACLILAAVLAPLMFVVAGLQGLGALWLISLETPNRALVFIPFLVFQIAYTTVVVRAARNRHLI